MLVKATVIILLLVILFSLGSGLFFLIRDGSKSTRTAKALTLRIALSLCLFILLIVAAATGLITPHGVYPVAPPAIQNE